MYVSKSSKHKINLDGENVKRKTTLTFARSAIEFNDKMGHWNLNAHKWSENEIKYVL